MTAAEQCKVAVDWAAELVVIAATEAEAATAPATVAEWAEAALAMEMMAAAGAVAASGT